MTVRAEDHLGLVGQIAKGYAKRSGKPVEELFQEGVIGLMAACRKFDPGRGVAFSTYAYWWIASAISKSLDEDRLVHLPNTILAKAKKTGNLPPAPISLDRKRPFNPKNFEKVDTLHDIIPDPSIEPADVAAERAEMRAAVRIAVTTLTKREQFVLEMRFVEEMTLEEIGKLLGVCHERVHQIEAEAIETLRGRLRAFA